MNVHRFGREVSFHVRTSLFCLLTVITGITAREHLNTEACCLIAVAHHLLTGIYGSILSGNIITATANILLTKDGQQLRGIGVGDGPIDAAFLAIEQIIGHHYELDDFQIQTVSEGRDAMGSAVVKLRADGKVYSGSGISTDIIGASIRAYISALNKIVYEE